MTQNELKELLDYDPNTGVFRWKQNRGPNAKTGTVAGTKNNMGYHVIRIDNILYYGHRLAWLYMTGNWPSHQIDHINGNSADNRLCNLRECSNAENAQNFSLNKKNKTGYTGVFKDKRTNKFISYITINYKRKHIGVFDTPEEAHDAYLKAKAELHTFQPVPR